MKLLEETNRIKVAIDKKVKHLKRKIECAIKEEKYLLVWEYLQNFSWLRLGLHEYVFDVCFKSSSLPEDDVRDYVLASLYNKMDLSIEPLIIFTDEEILHSLRYKFSWNRFGVCSYDCGPLTIGKREFVKYKIAAKSLLDLSKNLEEHPHFKICNI